MLNFDKEMIKLLIPLILLFSVSSVFGQEINGEIEYVVELSFDKEKLKKMSGSTRTLLQNATPVKASLTFFGDEAIYELKEGIGNDSQKGTNITRILAGSSDLYYHNRKIAQTIRQTSTSGKTFLVEYPSMEWKILRETKKIGKYKCYKAVHLSDEENKTVAWFAPEISAGFGPLYYNGLPGLILELQTSKGSFRAKSIDFDPENLSVQNPTEGERVTKEEYYEILKRMAPTF
ncbi:GLPGLI family protein [Salinimicrobium marinum]|uniref:GLPGLI family protein n=2 Tax=Salinimicrobium marinum TaxID=680283 RepID=A0A918W2E2_9FLAO|nr:GLPGLI family protein [Salinimicrobium marinum]